MYHQFKELVKGKVIGNYSRKLLIDNIDNIVDNVFRPLSSITF